MKEARKRTAYFMTNDQKNKKVKAELKQSIKLVILIGN